MSKNRKEIEKREAGMAGSSCPKSKLNRKTGANWMEKQRRFDGGTREERKKGQEHYRNDDYYQNRRVNDPEWANKEHESNKKKGWKRVL